MIRITTEICAAASEKKSDAHKKPELIITAPAFDI